MSTLCTGFGWRAMRLRGNERSRGLNGDQHGLRSQELDKGPSDLTAWPIAPAHRLSRNRRGGWYLFSRRRRLVRLGDRRSTCWRGGHRRGGARPEHSTYPSRLECRARFLTLFAQRTGAAMANAGGIQHAQGAVTFWPTFLHKERMACSAATIFRRRTKGTVLCNRNGDGLTRRDESPPYMCREIRPFRSTAVGVGPVVLRHDRGSCSLASPISPSHTSSPRCGCCR